MRGLNLVTKYKIINDATKEDLSRTVATLNFKTNPFIVLKISDTIFCQGTVIEDNAIYVENRTSDELLFTLNRNVNKTEFIKILESIFEKNNNWETFDDWEINVKEDTTKNDYFNKLQIAGYTIIILGTFLYVYCYDSYIGSRIVLPSIGLQIEIVYLFLIALIMTLPSSYLNYRNVFKSENEFEINQFNEILRCKKIKNKHNDLIWIVYVVMATIFVFIQTINI